MILRKLSIAALSVLAAAAVFSSCNKDEEDTAAAPYLTGNPKFSADRYVEAGSKHVFTAEEVTNATGAEVKYSWTVTRDGKTDIDSETTETDGGRTFEYTFKGVNQKDTLCNFRVSCTASATGYSSTSYSADVTTVSGKSLISEGDSPLSGSVRESEVTDQRDSRTYRTIIVNGLEWTAENLAYEGEDGKTGRPLEDAEAVSGIFGRFYKWNEAKEVCEGLGSGWRLPTVEDWDNLGSFFKESGDAQELTAGWSGINGKIMTNVYFNGDEMWEYWPAVKITNESGFSTIPLGYATVVEKEFSGSSDDIWTFAGFSEYAGFWTSTGYTAGQEPGAADDPVSKKAYYVYIYENNDDLRINYVDKTAFALPVRCVRDSQ